jgi:hypothetical protein
MRLSGLALLPLVPAALGCAGTVSSGADGVDAEGTATTSALVSIERTSDPTVGSRAEASARFLRVLAPSSADDALRAIGAALELPAVGACAAMASHASDGPAQLPLPPLVELVDVGGVNVEAAGVETRMSPRQLPDVTDVVSGVVYSRGTDPALLPDSARYQLRVAGTAGFEPFTVSASAAGDPADVRIAGEDEAGTLTAAGATLEVSWPASSVDDLIYLDVRPAGVRCTLGNSGDLRSAGGEAMHASVSTLLLDDAGTLVIHRLHREPLRAQSVDSGEIRFDFARTVPYVRR